MFAFIANIKELVRGIQFYLAVFTIYFWVINQNENDMKAKWTIIWMFFALVSSRAFGETIAVAGFSTIGLHATPEIVNKLARLELVKTEKYSVLDEFDMDEVLEANPEYKECYGKNCLIELGRLLQVDYLMAGSVDGLGNKIVVTCKLLDVKQGTLEKTQTMEFESQEPELQRMMGIVIRELLGITADPITKTSLEFKNEVITSDNVGRINNSGPRMGFSYVATGQLNEFFTRKENQGGLEIQPFMTNIGYQFEGQYVGTENFSALVEFIVNAGGMEQGHFIPSASFLNGFRFGRSGWEFAFGPSLSIRKTSMGFFNEGEYVTQSQWESQKRSEWQSNPDNFDANGAVLHPYVAPDPQIYSRHLDARGRTDVSANWVMAFGRTFRSGALNIPVNIYYSSNKYGGILGASVGFNVNRKKVNINS